jgi:hypothetical protein
MRGVKGFAFWCHVAFFVVFGAALGLLAFTEWGWVDKRYMNAITGWAIEHWKTSIAIWVGTEALAQWLDRTSANRRHPPPSPGTCRSCGYDLRATPDRCPECGATADGR